MIQSKIIYLLSLLMFLSCSSSNNRKEINSIDINLITKSKAKFFVIYPIKSNSNYEIFKNTVIVDKEITDKYQAPIIPFIYINSNNDLKSKLIEDKIDKKDVLLVKPRIKKTKTGKIIHYIIEFDLEDHKGKGIIHLVDKFDIDSSNLDNKALLLDSTYYISRSLKKLTKFLIRFMKQLKNIKKLEYRKINPAYILNYKIIKNENEKIENNKVVELIKILYPKIKKEDIEILIKNKNNVFFK